MPFPFLDQVTHMLRHALGDSLAPGADYLDLFSEDAVFEFPFSPGGGVRVEGKDKMAAYLRSIEGGIALDGFTLKAKYPMADGRTTVLEYDSEGRHLKTGRPYVQSYVTVLQVSGGRITAFREYLNPLAIMAASKPAEDALAVRA